ncbi:MAG TPA: serine/threonine-protein kinase [Gemmataceae bacterium]|nr:serine/threonine-protein kinase [Gemmataceae bacterium]
MPQVKQCVSCQTELESDSSDSYCPKCLPLYGVTATAATPPGSEAQTPGQRAFFAAPAPSELAPRFPQLEIISLLGLGGMGAVYKARQPALDRFVALKILPAEASRDASFTERFTREARALARLSHPGIVTVYDFGQSDGLYHFIMEYVDGANLRQMMKEGSLTPKEALRLIPQICDALQFAHDEGVIHRDIKPENILVDRKGRVKIADFGIAKLLGPKTTDHTLTGPWQVMGTMHYMAPEQMDNPLGLDHRADIYSVGVVVYEMLTNQLPRGNFPLPSQKSKVDPRLDQIVLRALETEPGQRYQRISEIKTAVEALTAQPLLEVLPVRTYRKPGILRRDPTIVQAEMQAPAQALLWAGIVDLAVSFIGLITFLFRGSTEMGFAYLMICIGMGVAIILGSRKMKVLEARGFALLCAVFAMLPIPPGCLITFPIGIWVWSSLRRDAVRRAFEQKLHEGVEASKEARVT